jgi:hypothetical protein
LRYEYLQEKLSREISPTNNTVILTLPKSATIRKSPCTLARHYPLEFAHGHFTRSPTGTARTFCRRISTPWRTPTTRIQDYLNTEHAQDFSINMSLSLFGIGAQLSEDDGYCTISQLIHGGPAEKSKQIKEKDRIVAVAQGNQPPVNVVDMELGKGCSTDSRPKRNRGAADHQSGGQTAPSARVVTLIRDEIKLEDQEARAQAHRNAGRPRRHQPDWRH